MEFRCRSGCLIVEKWYCSLGLSPDALGVLRPPHPTISADYVNHVFLGQRHSDSASSFYTCRYHSVREEPFRYLRPRVAEVQLSHHRPWRASPRLTSYVNSPPFPFTLERRSFTARVELPPMTSGAGNMLFVLASGLPDLNIGTLRPQGRWAEHHHVRTIVHDSRSGKGLNSI